MQRHPVVVYFPFITFYHVCGDNNSSEQRAERALREVFYPDDILSKRGGCATTEVFFPWDEWDTIMSVLAGPLAKG
jgi:hypothetical protein